MLTLPGSSDVEAGSHQLRIYKRLARRREWRSVAAVRIPPSSRPIPLSWRFRQRAVNFRGARPQSGRQ